MQGRLRDEEALTFDIQTECADCGWPLRMEMDRSMNVRLANADAQTLLFSPNIDWAHFDEPNIIHAY